MISTQIEELTMNIKLPNGLGILFIEREKERNTSVVFAQKKSFVCTVCNHRLFKRQSMLPFLRSLPLRRRRRCCSEKQQKNRRQQQMSDWFLLT